MGSRRSEPLLDFEDYKVVWIAPLEIEAQAALHMLDNIHEGYFPSSSGDDYTYLAGDINKLNIVIATLPPGYRYGVGAAAALATQVRKDFPNIWFGLLVGVAAGLPNLRKTPPRDIRLGDVLVGFGAGDRAGIVNYGFGKETDNGFEVIPLGTQAKTSPFLSSKINRIKLLSQTSNNSFENYYQQIKDKTHGNGNFADPGQDKDKLYQTTYNEDNTVTETKLVEREARSPSARTAVWYGPIGSGDTLMRSAKKRDELRDKFDLIGLEMEAAGTIDRIPVAVIRGVCDYGDAQKNKEWQPYAAAMAAAYAKHLLNTITPAMRQGKQVFEANDLVRAPQITPQRGSDVNIGKPLKPIFMSTLPNYSNPIFAGREDELAHIGRIFANSNVLHQRVLLYGLGGIGKSQIAFEHAQRCSQERSVFWVKADTAENIISGYSAIARLTVPGFQHLTKAEILLAVKNHLESPDTLPWLLILDEANDKELFMSPSDGLNLIQYIPRSARGQVLITTRDRQITRLASGQIVPPRNSFDVKPMPNHDGFALLQKCMFSECEWLPSQNECQTFLQMLGGLPLAIIQAASYMLNTHTSVDQFVVLYMNIELHNSIFKDPAVDIDMRQMSVLYTWEISYQKIAGTGPKSRSAMLLDILGFIDSPDSGLRHLSEAEFIFKDHDEPTPIQGLEKSFETQKNPSSLLATIFDDHIEPNADHAFREYIGRLYDYSLVTTWDCWVHPVVQNWISRRPQLRLDERCQYIDWLVEKLLDQIILSDDYSENRLEHFLLPSTYNSLAAPELTPFRHAVVVLSHARLEIVAEYMASHEHFAFRLASLLYKVGRIAASMGQIVDGISYLEKAFEIMDNVENPTLLSEIRLQLAKMQQRFTSPAAAIAEARLCNEGHPSREAMLWLAQCLQSGGGLPRLQEALEWFDIINTLLTNDTEGAEVDNVVIAARVGAMQVLSEIGDHESKTRARDIIDNTLKSYFGKLPTGHMLQTILYPEILICRVDVADGHRDQADAVQRFIRHTIKAREAMQDKIIAQCSTVQDVTCPYQYLNGILPQEWLEYLLILQTKEKWAASEALADGFIQRLPPIDILIDLYWESQADPEELERFFAEIDTWGDICYNLGRACIKQGKFEKAERAHWRALGLWLYLGLFRDFSSGFDSNLRGLDKALAKQGPGRLPSLRRLRRFFKTRFVEEEETRRGLLVRTSLVGTRWN